MLGVFILMLFLPLDNGFLFSYISRMSKTPKSKPLSELELEAKLHQLTLPLKGLMDTIKLIVTPHDPECGDLMTLEEFAEDVRNGCLMDYDGFGKWATATHVTNIHVYPSEYQDWPIPPKTEPPITHIVWYNK